ncbi:MAG: hypothetical protein EOM19_06520 [Candidatus Moranbacteria bacterium]|nr:hypothetical protein [Candidatus Moranbacteria bacterium]
MKNQSKVKNLFLALFDILLSEGQLEIAEAIIYKEHKRVQIICCTQYGKSFTVALAVLFCMAIKKEKFVIVAPSTKKAKIIMSYIIDYIEKSSIFLSQLQLEAGDSYDRLKRERSKNKIDFLNGGSVEVLSLDARNSRKNIQAAMGEGGQNIILDESSLVEDTLYATVKRMIGGYGDNGFLLEIGNPFYRNHFYRTWNGEKYKKIFIDYKRALQENRFTNDFIEEMRGEALFDIFYQCTFPDEDIIDERGYRQLLTFEDVRKAQERYIESENKSNLKLGIDIGGGGDSNVYELRNENAAEIIAENRSNDTMTNISETQRIMHENQIKAEEVFIDDIGIGRGVTDRLKELGLNINSVSVGGTAQDTTKFRNIKAENYFAMAEWIKNGGSLKPHEKWQQLTWIKYKVSSDKQIQIEPKDELKKRTGKSPDFAEALMLTFTKIEIREIQFF